MNDKMNTDKNIAGDMISDAERDIKALRGSYESKIAVIRRDYENKLHAEREMFTYLSREIRTPMNAIMGLASLAETSPADSETVSECIAKIKLSADYISNVLGDILNMESCRSEVYIPREEIIRPEEFFRAVNKTIKESAEQKKIAYSFRISKFPADYFVSDQSKLRRMLVNILDNAVKFTPADGKVSLSVKAVIFSECENGRDALRFKITDNGIGINEDFLPHIFEPFTQEELSQTDDKSKASGNSMDSAGEKTSVGWNGIGLGLAVSRRIIDELGGSIDVVSTHGEGSTFTIEIPVTFTRDSLGAKRPATPRSTSVRTTRQSDDAFTGKRILLVEDHELNVEVVKKLLERKLMTVDVARNGLAAIEAYAAAPSGSYDAILMDISMPIMNGLIAAEKIRAFCRADSTTIPIIAMTANAFEDDIEASQKSGMNAHLIKPITPSLLYSTLRENFSDTPL
ncbi:MAG: ATP-binding protein [Eubacteriales bacterium]